MIYSFSRISNYLRCPRKARFRYIDKIPPETTPIALPLGSAIHDIVAWSVQNPEADRDVLDKNLREFLISRIDTSRAPVESKGLSLEEVYDQAKGMFAVYYQAPLQGITQIEQSFRIPLTQDIELEGFIDFLRGDEVVELKTAARSYFQLQVDLNLQATCYAAALMKKIDPVCVLFHVIVKNKTPKVQSLTTWRSQEDLDILKSVAKNVDRGFREKVFPRNISVQNCSGCEYQNQCLKAAVAVP